jgi:hypothetical protein
MFSELHLAVPKAGNNCYRLLTTLGQLFLLIVTILSGMKKGLAYQGQVAVSMIYVVRECGIQQDIT